MSNRPQGLLAANLICMFSMLIWAAGLPANGMLIPLLPSIDLSASRMSMAALALLPFWIWREGSGVLRNAGWLKGIGVGGMIGAGGLMVILGQSLTDAVTVAVISATMPIVGVALEVVFDGRKLSLSLVLGLLLALAGGIVALGSGIGGLNLGLGALICLGSVLCFTLGSRLTVTAFPALTPLGRTTVTLSGAAIASVAAALTLAALGNPAPDFLALGLKDWGALVLFAVGSLGISQLLWIMSVGSLGIGLAALHINAAPFYVMAILWAFGAPWNWTQALGAAIVGLGVLVAQGIIPIGRTEAAA